MERLNYKKLNGMINFRYADQKYKAAKGLGFEHISEAVINLYSKLSTPQIAIYFDVHRWTVCNWLRIWGIDRKERGGDRKEWFIKYGSENCKSCGVKTVKGYRGLGRCGPCHRYFQRRGHDRKIQQKE